MLSILPKILSAFTCKSHQKKNLDKINKLNFQGTTAIGTITLTFSLFSPTSVNAASFTFSQEGWQDGGNLSGSFVGDDLNNDGKIETSELSTFNAIFSGNLRNMRNPNLPLLPSTIFHSLPLPESDIVVRPTLNFEYSFSTSQLSFRSSQTTCAFSRPRECFRLLNASDINVSNTGGTVLFARSIQDRSEDFTSISSSELRVTPVQQTIPEPSTLGAILLGGLGFLLRKKVVSSRTTTETTNVRS